MSELVLRTGESARIKHLAQFIGTAAEGLSDDARKALVIEFLKKFTKEAASVAADLAALKAELGAKTQ